MASPNYDDAGANRTLTRGLVAHGGPALRRALVHAGVGSGATAFAMYGTGTGAVTAVVLAMDGGSMGTSLIGIPVPRAMRADNVAVSWLADTPPPSGPWTATLQRRAVGGNYAAVATFSIDTS